MKSSKKAGKAAPASGVLKRKKTMELPKLKPLKALKALRPEPAAKKSKGQPAHLNNPQGRPIKQETLDAAKGLIESTRMEPYKTKVPANLTPAKYRNNVLLNARKYLEKRDMMPEGVVVKSALRGRDLYLWLEDEVTF